MEFTTLDAMRHGLQTVYTTYRKTLAPEDEMYCHYTSPGAFISIFDEHIKLVGQRQYRDGEQYPILTCTMRASHLRFLNDSNEYVDGFRWIERHRKNGIEDAYKDFKWIEKNRKIRLEDTYKNNVYSISFCGNNDLLSQWKWYGKNSGIAISFAMDNIQYKYYELLDKENSVLPIYDDKIGPIPVKYSEDEKKQYHRQLYMWNETNSEHIQEVSLLAGLFMPFCKDEGFQEEKETRLIFHTADADSSRRAGVCFPVHYYVSENIVKPTLQVVFQAKDRSKSIVNSLIIGPGQNQELIYRAVVHMLSGELPSTDTDSIEIGGTVVRKSKIPFRG